MRRWHRQCGAESRTAAADLFPPRQDPTAPPSHRPVRPQCKRERPDPGTAPGQNPRPAGPPVAFCGSDAPPPRKSRGRAQGSPDSAAGTRSPVRRTRRTAASRLPAAASPTVPSKGSDPWLTPHRRRTGFPACRRRYIPASTAAPPYRSRRDGSWPRCTPQYCVFPSLHYNSRHDTET